jgi:RHS repeat-associated protein
MIASPRAFAVLGLFVALECGVGSARADTDCLGDFNQDGQVNTIDVLSFLNSWNAASPGADYNGDGNINTVDVLTFLNRWNAGCPAAVFAGDPNPNELGEPEFALPGDRPGCGQRPTIGHKLEPVLSGVHPFSGETFRVEEDMTVQGRVMDFRFVRKYRSQGGPDTAIGNRWDFSYNIFIEKHGPHINVHNGAGRVDTYRVTTAGRFLDAEHLRALQLNGNGSYTLLFSDGGEWRFGAFDGSARAGKIESIVDRNGNSMGFTYDGQGRLVAVLDDLGRVYSIGYDADGMIGSVCDFTGRCWVYTYYGAGDPDGLPGDLRTVTTPAIVGTPNGNDFPDGRTVRYTYTTGNADDRLNHMLTSVTDPRGFEVVSNEYDTTSPPGQIGFGRLDRQRLGDGPTPTDLVYVAVQPQQGNNFATLRVILNTRDGSVKEAFYDGRNLGVLLHELTGFADPNQPTTPTENRPGAPLRATDPARFEHRWQYESSGLVREVLFPSGARIVRTHDLQNADPRARGNLLELRRLAGPYGGDQAELVETFEYLSGFGGCCATSFVTRHVNARGNERTFAYDDRGNRLSAAGTQPGDVVEWEYDLHGRKTAVVHADDGEGRRQRDESTYYDAGPMNGYLRSEIIDAGGLAIETTYEYNDRGNMNRSIDAEGRDTTAFVNELGEIVREVSQVAYGQNTRVTKDNYFDASGNIVRVDEENRDHLGEFLANSHFTRTYEYDALGRLARQTQEIAEGESKTVELLYDVTGRVAQIRSGEAVNGNQPDNTVTRWFDERGKLYRETLGAGGQHASTTQHDYNLDGFSVREVAGLEAGGRETLISRDGFGRPTGSTDPMGNQSAFNYDANGNTTGYRVFGELLDLPGSAGNVRLHEQRTTYNEADLPVRMERDQFDPVTGDPIGDEVEFTDWAYSPGGRLLRQFSPDGGMYEVGRDTAGRRAFERLANGVEVRYFYNALHQVVRMEAEHTSETGGDPKTLTTLYTYDAFRRLTGKTEPDGGVWEFGWDARDNRTRVRDPRGNVVETSVDGAGRVVERRRLLTDTGDGSGQVVGDIAVRYEYDDSGRITRRVDDLGRVTAYEYDALDRTVRAVHADGTVVTHSYDALGDLLATQDANGTVIQHQHDLAGRLTRRDVTPGQGVANDTTFETFAYDGAGRLVSAANDATQVLRRVDSMGNLLEDAIDGVPVVCEPDAEGNPLTCVYPSGRSFGFSYRPDGRASTVSFGGEVVAAFNYLGGLGLERARYTDLPGNAFIDELTSYDDAGRFDRLAVVRDDGSGQRTALDDRTFTWDNAGNRAFAADTLQGGSGFTHEYAYDSANRLLRSDSETDMGEVVIGYTLDGVGNRTMVSGGADAGPYSADPMHQYTSTPFDARSYDAMGNTRSMNGGGVNATLAWNYKHELVRWEDAVSGRVVRFVYDALGRPVRRIETGPTPGTTAYRWLGDGLAEEFNPGNGQAKSYAHAAGDIRLLVTNAGVHHMHPDGSATVYSITSDAGLLAARYDYTDYGAVRNLMQPQVPNTRLFAGLWLDQGMRLYRAGHRFFEARTGKMISRDPLGVWGDRANTGNGSLYAGANPWSRRDPSGMATCGNFGTPNEWMCYDFDDCTSGDEDAFHDNILGRTLAGVEDVEWDVQEELVDSLVEQWFDGCGGSVSSSEYSDINDAIEDVEVSMEDKTLYIECEYSGGWSNWCYDEDDGGKGYSAYVVATNEVHLCDDYFDYSPYWTDRDHSKNDQAQDTYYHELHHAYNNFGDQGYYTSGSGTDGCPNYTIDDGDANIAAEQEELRKNPDTYSSMARFANPSPSESNLNGYFAPY